MDPSPSATKPPRAAAARTTGTTSARTSPDQPVISVVQALAAAGNRIVYVSGRSEACGTETGLHGICGDSKGHECTRADGEVVVI
ncbi:hypothetical protein GCM10009780_63050 [Actinomadura alba]